MRLSKRKRSGSVGFDMTPMIDVVFLLLIFFMTVTQQSRVERERIELPKQTGSDDQAESSLVLNLTHRDRLIHAGEPISLGDLDRLVQRETRRLGAGPDLVKITLRVDQRADSALVNQVMVRLRQSGVKRIRIAVEVAQP